MSKPIAGRSEQLLVPIFAENHKRYGRVEITAADVRQMAENFDADVKTYHGMLPVTEDHDESRGARGWIDRVWTDDRGLWGEITWNRKGLAAIDEMEFPFLSPEWRDNWTDPRSATKHRNVFEGMGMVVRPEIRDLPPASLKKFAEDAAPLVLVLDEETAADPTEPAGETEEPVDKDIDQAGLTPSNAPAAAPKTVEGVLDTPSPSGADAELKQFRERLAAQDETLKTLQERNAALEREGHVRKFGEAFEPASFGVATHRLVPESRKQAAELAADLYAADPELAKRFGEFVTSAQMYPLKPVGSAAGGAVAEPIDELIKSFAEGSGLSDDELRTGRENTVWKREDS